VAERAKILIIDDEDVVLDSCLLVFEGENYEVATARDGAAGLALVPEFQPDLILVDLMMPGISGFDVLARLREIDPTLVAIVITGYSTVNSAVEAMKQGAFDFLPKPFTPEELRLITRRGIEKRRLVLETIALRRERETLRENFAAIISHELRSPLAAVQQNLFGLVAELEGQLTPAQQERFGRLKGRLGDLIGMIQTWLKAVSTSVDKIRESFVPTALPPLIGKAVETVQPHAMRKGITIGAAVREPLPPVLGDAGTLTEALVNLIGNAVKYTPANGSVEVRAHAEGAEVVLEVADDGVGIAPEDLPHLFGDFYRARSSAGGEAGAGLGLALTKRIVEAHAGSVAVASEVGKGTTFTIRLPAHGADTQSPAGTTAAAPSTRDPGDQS
jgi:two-component system, sensor histidine kinase and response regulator